MRNDKFVKDVFGVDLRRENVTETREYLFAFSFKRFRVWWNLGKLHFFSSFLLSCSSFRILSANLCTKSNENRASLGKFVSHLRKLAGSRFITDVIALAINYAMGTTAEPINMYLYLPKIWPRLSPVLLSKNAAESRYPLLFFFSYKCNFSTVVHVCDQVYRF